MTKRFCRFGQLKDDAGNVIDGSTTGPVCSETLDLADFSSAGVQINANTIGNVTFEVSNDKVNWIEVESINGTLPIGIDLCKTGFRYARVCADSGTNIEMIIAAKE